MKHKKYIWASIACFEIAMITYLHFYNTDANLKQFVDECMKPVFAILFFFASVSCGIVFLRAGSGACDKK